MAKSSIRYINSAGLQNSAREKDSVVYGRFPKRIKIAKASTADKVNAFLSSLLIFLVMLSLISYYFVSDSEKIMNSLGREIVALNNENIELQNKLDNLHSFNKVDAVIQGKTSLNTAKRVIEIPAAVNITDTSKRRIKIPVNYKWSIGY